MRSSLIGLDIGGANLKAATVDGQARSLPFQLWKNPGELGEALIALTEGHLPKRIAVTMTGEFCDCFETKQQGVSRILEETRRAFSTSAIEVWSSEGRFVEAAESCRDYMEVAAANWHALATWAGRALLTDFRSAILIDIGSTTTDIIPIWAGQPRSVATTDSGRLQSKELVYTGVRRTPICALLTEGIAAELFAATEDAYLRLGMLNDDATCLQTADGRPATAKHAHARLSRMLGGDPVVTSEERTYQLAQDVYQHQRRLAADAIAVVTSKLPEPPSAVLFSGSGEFLALAAWNDFAAERELASLPPVKLLSLAELLRPELSAAACAYAVAKLAEEL